MKSLGWLASSPRSGRGQPGKPLLEKVAAKQAVLVSTGAKDWLESSGEVERVDGGYRVTAKKPFASGTPRGAMFITSSRYYHTDEGWQVLHFGVPRDASGVQVADDWDTLGMRATGSNTVAKALEAAGGFGFHRASGLERMVRDAKGIGFHPLPEKNQVAFSGRMALGLEPIMRTEAEKPQKDVAA